MRFKLITLGVCVIYLWPEGIETCKGALKGMTPLEMQPFESNMAEENEMFYSFTG